VRDPELSSRQTRSEEAPHEEQASSGSDVIESSEVPRGLRVPHSRRSLAPCSTSPGAMDDVGFFSETRPEFRVTS
jgi:hypothetical protein